jgi:tRNA G18 (ribose-2'-O)-methylase SpoU
MISRECREQLKAERRHALKRYEKHRRRNLMATPGEHEFIVVLDHLKAGFNVPKIFRSAEAFGAHEVHLIGIGPFDPAPAKGAFKHVPARFHDDFDSCYRELHGRGYRLFALEPDCPAALPTTPLPKRAAFVLGHEERGMSFVREEYPGVACLTIPQLGQVQSLNVSVAASVVMYEYVRQHSTGTE